MEKRLRDFTLTEDEKHYFDFTDEWIAEIESSPFLERRNVANLLGYRGWRDGNKKLVREGEKMLEGIEDPVKRYDELYIYAQWYAREGEIAN